MNNIKKYACGGVIKPCGLFIEGDSEKELLCQTAEMPIGIKVAVAKTVKDIQNGMDKSYEYSPL